MTESANRDERGTSRQAAASSRLDRRLVRALYAAADRFVPPGEHDVDRLGRTRTGIVVGWMGILFAGLSVPLYTAYGSPISGVAISAIVVGLVLTAPAIRAGLPVEAAAHGLTAITWLVTFVVAWRTGGFASPAVVWAFFHPITTYIACGKRSAIVWSLLSGGQLAILFALQRGGVDFPTDLSAEQADSVRLGSLLVAVLANTMVIGGNESIRRQTEELRGAASRAIERQRILGDLHDGVGSQLLGLMIQVRAKAIDDERLVHGLESCMDDLRLIVDSLDPVERSLDVSLAELRERLQPRCAAAGVELRWHVPAAASPLPVDGVQALQVLRALQEMFSNALRHSGSDRIDFSVSGPSDGDRSIVVEVRDHGTGFDPATTRAGARGLTSLRSRAHRLGGDLTIEPAGPGTRVRLVFAAAGADGEPSLTSPSRRATVAR